MNRRLEDNFASCDFGSGRKAGRAGHQKTNSDTFPNPRPQKCNLPTDCAMRVLKVGLLSVSHVCNSLRVALPSSCFRGGGGWEFDYPSEKETDRRSSLAVRGQRRLQHRLPASIRVTLPLKTHKPHLNSPRNSCSSRLVVSRQKGCTSHQFTAHRPSFQGNFDYPFVPGANGRGETSFRGASRLAFPAPGSLGFYSVR
ncbi:unnamed protein product [Protopolystoma xenopodis]|uniref:Uncharacterized protein n=1 Tax=Protopolystoma xenopodis TaxID=117903 RepID=A0A448X8R9_9PLAT|nr:unnamed protein product [Protopolystoma xenopodis]